MNLRADLFLSLRPPKNVGRSMSKRSRFRFFFKKKHGKLVRTLLRSERQHLYHIDWEMGRQLSCKKSLLVIWKILRLFVSTLSAIDKYSLLHRDNLMQPIQMQLCQKEKPFSPFFSAFLKSSLNFEHFEKKDDRHSLFITDSEKRAEINV